MSGRTGKRELGEIPNPSRPPPPNGPKPTWTSSLSLYQFFFFSFYGFLNQSVTFGFSGGPLSPWEPPPSPPPPQRPPQSTYYGMSPESIVRGTDDLRSRICRGCHRGPNGIGRPPLSASPGTSSGLAELSGENRTSTFFRERNGGLQLRTGKVILQTTAQQY